MSGYMWWAILVMLIVNVVMGVLVLLARKKKESMTPPAEKQIFSTPLHVVIWEPSSNVKDEPWSIYRIIMDPAPDLESIFCCRNETVARKITALLEVRANDERQRKAAREKPIELD